MKTLGQILGKNNSQFQKLVVATQQTETYDKLLRSCLEAELAEHCHFAAINEQQLTIVVDNAAWATRLRYAIPDVLKNLRVCQEFKDIIKIRYTINKYAETSIKKEHKKRMSASSESLWKEMLNSLRVKKK